MPDQPSAQWEPKNVLKRLRKATASGQSASAQVFVNDAVAADELQDKAKQIVDERRRRPGSTPAPSASTRCTRWRNRSR